MKKMVLLVILSLLALESQAQQDAIYAQYAFNPFAINPAYAGSRQSVNMNLINRNQWVGLEGAPNTQTLSAHLPSSKYPIAYGINISRDQLGPTTNLVALLTGVYQLKMETGALNFGLRGGIFNSIFDHSKLRYREANDIMDIQERRNAMAPTFDFGMYYYTDRMFVGLSMNHLTRHQLNYYDQADNSPNYLRKHLFLSGGYAFPINNNLLFKPTILLKYVESSGFNADLNLNVLFKEKMWLGVGLRNISSVNLLVDFNITDYLRAGYAYELNLTKLHNYSYGSHEFVIGYDFNVNKAAPPLPRYL
jgi:type IX secretion system PorP/SprF family membrane protein